MSGLSCLLHVEDSPHDATWFRLAYEEAAIPNPLITVPSVRKALDYLRLPAAPSLLPTLLVTDLHLPGLDGFALLAWVRQWPHLRHLPVVVLSACDEPEQRLRALSLGARDYAQKQVPFPVLVKLLQHWRSLWLASPPPAQPRPGRSASFQHSPPTSRVLLRQGSEYLQLSGAWGPSRQTARAFPSPLAAYWWARKRQLLGVEVLLAFTDPADDFVPLRA